MRKFLLLVVLGAASIWPLHAQVSFSDYFKDGNYLFDDEFKLMKTDVFTTYKSQFGLTSDDALILKNEQEITSDHDEDIDMTVTCSRYQHYYKEYEVEYRTMNVFSKCGVVLMVNGNPVTGLNIDVSSPMTESSALSEALDYIDPPLGYTWQNSAYELSLIELTRDTSGNVDSSITSYPEGDLLIAKKYGEQHEDAAENYALCWKFGINFYDTVTHDSLVVDSTMTYNVFDTIIRHIVVYVNAENGQVWGAYDPSRGSGFHTGSVWTWYHGARNDIETFRDCFITPACPYKLVSSRGISTLRLNSSNNIEDVNATNNSWVDGALEKEPASAHWAIEKAYDYYKFVQFYVPKKYINVIVNNKNINGSGARWSTSAIKAIKGEDEISLQPGFDVLSFTSLDIMGHELTHAVINQSSQLGANQYRTEATALNEGFSDIMGLAAETWVEGWCDWDYGDNGFYGLYKRRFNDPNNDIHLNASGNSANSYNDVTWNNANSDYIRSGPLRRWFNHLSQGAWNWIPAYSGATFNTAVRIAHLSSTYGLTSTSTYADTRANTLHCADLFYGGYCGQIWKKVERAWYDVGVGGQTQCKVVGLTGDKVSSTDRLANGLIRLKVTDNIVPYEEGPQLVISGFVWIVPPNWEGTLEEDDAVYNLTSVNDDYSSKMIKVVVNYELDGTPHTDTLSIVQHFSDECSSQNKNPDSQPGLLQPVAEINSHEVKVFPNPTSDYLNIIIPNDIKEAAVVITDVSGKDVHRTNIHFGYNNVSLPKLSPGIYLLRISGDRMNVVKRVMIK
jgi:hypothetical protein